MNCNQLRNQFDERLDGRLDEAEREAFDRHVAICPGCGREWREQAALWQVLTRSTDIAPSFGFVERTLRQLDAPVAHAAGWSWQLVWRWVLVGGTALVLAASGWLFWQRARNAQLASLYAQVHQDVLNDDFEIIAGLDQLTSDRTRL